MKILGLLGLLTVTILLTTVMPDQRFDEYGNLCVDDEKARLDNFAITLKNHSEWIGYIIVYAGRHSCINEAKYRGNRAKDWVVKGGVAADRVVVVDGGYKAEVVTDLEIEPNGARARHLLPDLDKKQVSIHKCVDKVFARKFCPTK